MPRLCTAIPYMYYKEEMFCTTCLDLYLLPMFALAAYEQELLLNVRPPSSRRLLRLIHLPFLLWYRRKSQAVIMICPEEKEADEEDEDDDAVEEDIAADENLFFFFSS